MCIRDRAADKGVTLLLPVDTVCADHFGADAAPVVYEAGKIPADMMGMDIGPKTVELFSEAVKDLSLIHISCIIPEVHAPGNYEFAVQILFYACCRTKSENDRLTLSTD